MEPNRNVDYIIVGQGIAGTCVSYQLLKKGFSIFVVDKGIEHSASSVAAGLYNPIVFKRFTQSWMAQELIEYLDVFYHEMEELLNSKFHTKLNIVKIFTNSNESDLWLKKSGTDKFMSKFIEPDYLKNKLQANAGAGFVYESGALDVNKFITSFRDYLNNLNNLMVDNFDYGELKLSDDCITYKGITAQKIIFCEGAQAINNPFFPAKAFKLTHGEVFEIESSELPEDEVVNKGVFILPTSNKKFKVGSTYEWDNITGMPSEKGKAELTEKIKQLIAVPFQIISHKAGIRPTVADRRPIIGKSDTNDKIYFFNGMGTKGVMLAPYFSNILMQHLTSKSDIEDEINIDRYF